MLKAHLWARRGGLEKKSNPSFLHSLFSFSNSIVEEDELGEPMLSDITLGTNFHAGKKQQWTIILISAWDTTGLYKSETSKASG